ncbi:MAG: hypothetical protein AB8F65_06480 [Woeseiaceae bacterium]
MISLPAPFSMIVLVVLIGCATGVIKHYLDLKAQQPMGSSGGETDPEVREIIGRLEHRVQVLERIVTDGGYSLKKEIDNL